jgi:hypothetical protein
MVGDEHSLNALSKCLSSFSMDAVPQVSTGALVAIKGMLKVGNGLGFKNRGLSPSKACSRWATV